jgi:hypothetical protein
MLLALLLCGCDVTASQERATDANVCANYGFKPGTPEFANCRMSRDQQRQAAYSAVIDQSIRNNQAEADRQIQQLQENYRQYRQNNSRPPINCTTIGLGGGMASTNCY